MAETIRLRVIPNKGHMTDAQIKFFGNARQKAALAQRQHHKTNKGGATKHVHRKKSKKIRQNIGELIGVTMRPVLNASNPGKKGAYTMATTTKKKSNKSRKATPKKKNPGKSVVRSNGTIIKLMKPNSGYKPTTRRKKNTGGATASLATLATVGMFTVGGAIGSKLITQMFLGTKNEGLMGYAGNAAVGAGLWYATDMVTRNKTASNAVLGGTAAQIFLRLLNDYTPFGSYLTELGVGDYQAQAFVTPQVLKNPMRNAEIEIPGPWRQPPPMPPMVDMAAAGPGVAGLYGGGGGLYSSGNGLY